MGSSFAGTSTMQDVPRLNRALTYQFQCASQQSASISILDSNELRFLQLKNSVNQLTIFMAAVTSTTRYSIEASWGRVQWETATLTIVLTFSTRLDPVHKKKKKELTKLFFAFSLHFCNLLAWKRRFQKYLKKNVSGLTICQVLKKKDRVISKMIMKATLTLMFKKPSQGKLCLIGQPQGRLQYFFCHNLCIVWPVPVEEFKLHGRPKPVNL